MSQVSASSRDAPRNRGELHEVICHGSTKDAVALITAGSVDVNQRDREGWTPLMEAAVKGCSQIVRTLLGKGASALKADDYGFTPLHVAAGHGHLGVTALLVKAGADLEHAATGNVASEGYTPLHVASGEGNSDVVRVLIKAGANPNSRASKGETALLLAARGAHLKTLKVLLRAKADPLLAVVDRLRLGSTTSPLEMATILGHLEVVRELIQFSGIEGCGGVTRGVDALALAAIEQKVEIMGILTGAGVVDTGEALIAAVQNGKMDSVRFLLQQKVARSPGVGYLNVRDPERATPLLRSVLSFPPYSPRMVRLLVDAGADPSAGIPVKGEGSSPCNGTVLAFTELMLKDKKVGGGKNATEEQLNGLEGIRRLLLRVDALRAVSWCWPNSVSRITAGAAAEVTARRNKRTSPNPLTAMLPILRRRTGRRGVLSSALLRWVTMISCEAEYDTIAVWCKFGASAQTRLFLKWSHGVLRLLCPP